MGNRLSADPSIRDRHYIRKPTADNHWFDFTGTKLREYRERSGDDFCLIVNGSETSDDAYIIPYAVARSVFTDDAADHRGRWVGTIVGSTMTLAPSGNTLNVERFHNAFDLLAGSGEMSTRKLLDA